MVLDGKCHKLFQRAFFPSQIEFYELVFVLREEKLRSDGMELMLRFKKVKRRDGDYEAFKSFSKKKKKSSQQNIHAFITEMEHGIKPSRTY